jgi:2-methylisocitrate lyase-like PEP mutase family enzyme
MRRACAAIDRPMMANMADGGKTPIRSARELEALGYACAIYPSMTALAAAAAVKHALQRLRDTGSSNVPDVPLHDFHAFCSLIGFEEVWAFERRWADAETPAEVP